MPIHDWTRVNPGIFHDFHHSWIEEIKRALNAGLLPADYYALAEQVVGDTGPDVLALQIASESDSVRPEPSHGPTAVATAPPKVPCRAQTEMDLYARKQDTVVIRHSSGDHVVAFVEIVSPGNKGSRQAMRIFIEKAAAFLVHGHHLTILDLQPPGPRDPNGIHGALWEEIADGSYQRPPDKPLTLASYDAGPPQTAYVDPVAVGDQLPDMPLFLERGHYVSLPLEATYRNAWNGVPNRWQRVLQEPAAARGS